jgi:cytochrome c-type biogenesis protein CcmH
MTLTRRQFLTRSAVAAGALTVASRGHAQQQSTQGAANVAMDQDAARSVRRPAKPGARPTMTDRERDDRVERNIRCQCGCTLDVYTCRTTDFACKVSPAMHGDIKSLVEGGYTAQEILDSFVDVYGERALMAPRPQGFNLVGYLAPFVALAAGAVAVVAVLRNWNAKKVDPVAPGVSTASATPEELARLNAAIRDDS